MPTDVWNALARVSARIAELAARDDELREGARALAAALYSLTERPTAPEPEAEAPPAAVPAAPAEEIAHPAANGEEIADDVLPIEQAVAALTFQRRTESPRPAWQEMPAPPDDDDLPRIAARCRLKAAGTRWAAERERRIAAGADYQTEIAPTDREIIDRARSIEDCYLWMNSPNWVAPPDLALLDDLAGCFDVLADALDAARAIRTADDEPPPEETLRLLAEAQSAVWAAVARVSLRTDPDQERAFIWLREATSKVGIFIPRHMRRDDPANPTGWRERAERVARFAADAGAVQGRERQRRKLFKKLEFVVGRCVAGEEDLEYGRERFAAAAEELLAIGVPASSPALCDLAAALFETDDTSGEESEALLPGASPAFAQVLREAARRRERLRSGDRNGVIRPTDEAEGPADVEDAVRRIEAEFPDAIAFALNGRSQIRGNPFEEPDRLHAALRFLATTYRSARLGTTPCPDLDAECRRQSGFSYRPHQSGTTVGMFADDYRTLWDGRTLTLRSHLAKGVSKDPRHTLRVAFDYDEERRIIVVGFIGQHQRTRAT